MTFADSRDIRPDRATPLSTEIIRWMPLFLRAVALAAVVAMAAMVEWPDIQTPDHAADHVASQPDARSEPVFDGRGKWGGYAR